MADQQDRNPDHAQAWIDLVCNAAQALGAESFYQWLLMVGQGTDEERTRKGRAFLDLQTGGGNLTDEVRLSANFKLVPNAQAPAPVPVTGGGVDRYRGPMAAILADSMLYRKPVSTVADRAWARSKALALGFMEVGPA